jgi:GTP-binding protein
LSSIERERGITILAKNVSVRYKGVKINIIDTPGHSDFGGEVERVINMADGVLLLVDAFEGPMPQTRFVLEKALELGLKPIVVINKVDKPNCNPDETHEAVFDLMVSLDANEDQLNFPTVFGSSKQGWMSDDWRKPTHDITCLLDNIIEYFKQPDKQPGTLQLQITSLDYSSYVGRIAIGRVSRGTIKMGQQVSIVKKDGSTIKSVVKELYLFEGLIKEKVKHEVEAGEICGVLCTDNFEIGDTIADFENPEGLKPIQVDEPTMSMLFTINNSPFAGKDGGQFLTSRHLRDRLYKETEKNLALKVLDTDSPERLLVYGRGILHLSVLVETMRREGYELQLGQPQIIEKIVDGVKHEPIEALTVHVPDEFVGRVIDIVTKRKGDLLSIDTKNDRKALKFTMPSRGLIGLTNMVLTATEGEAVIAHRFKEYAPWRGDISSRTNGSLIAMETGPSSAYSISKLQDRGKFFIDPDDDVYAGQIVGENTRQDDMVLNVVKTKKFSNMRASGSDEKIFIVPAIKFSLEDAMEYIREDEYVEVTPKSIRMRKIILNETERKRSKK